VPSDSELRDRFREGTQPRGEIDLDAVLRRARARRRPKVLLAGAGSVLAIAAIAVPAALSTSFGGGAGGSAIVAGDAYAPESATGAADGAAVGGAGQTMLEKTPAELLNRCMAPVADPGPTASGLLITVAPVSAAASERGIPLTVTLTNAGSERITGTTGSRPSVTFARDGIVLWHTNGPQDMMARIVDLAPGQSMSYPAEFEPVVCTTEDDAAELFRDDLPPAGPGAYTLSAVIDVISEDGTTVELVGGPAVDIVLG